MPWNLVPKKWKAGTLKSGGPEGPVVRNPKQMVAIMLAEKRKAAGQPEYRAQYQAGTTNVGLALFRAMQKRKKK